MPGQRQEHLRHRSAHGIAYLGDAANAVGLDSLFAAGAVAAVPEADSYAMMLAGLGLMGFVIGRRKRKARAI